MLASGLWVAPASAGTGTAGDPYTSLSEAYTAPASGRYFFNLGAGTFEADIDVSEGGGWVLVVQYVHQGGTNPALTVINAGANLPVTSTAALGADESAIASQWGHAGNAAINQFTGNMETRWFGQTSGHSRIVHFRTTTGISYLRTGFGSMAGVNTNFTALTGHSGITPATAAGSYSNQLDYAFTNFPFWQASAHHWGIRGTNPGGDPVTAGFRWEVDDFPNSSANSTIHRVWVRNLDPRIVINTNNSGAGSLREAITFANANPGADTISFAIPGAGPHTITISTALPQLTGAGDTIDGTTQPGASCGDLWAGTPHVLNIRLDGVNRSFNGITSAGSNHLIKGLSMTRFADAILASGTSSNAVVQCNYLGLASDGSASGNSRGASTFGASTLIGGLNANEGNVISGNATIAVSSGNGATAMAVRGNFIGTDPSGTASRSNAGGTISNQTGSATWSDITRNLISGNGGDGIDLQSGDTVTPSTGSIRIAGNYIGVDRTDTARLANGLIGIDFNAGTISGVVIGGTAPEDRNVISGNNQIGIRAGPAAGVSILGNIIGLAANGSSVIGNNDRGIVLNGTNNAQIGDGTEAGRNIISGQTNAGIQLNSNAANTSILGNYVGTDITGQIARGNANGIVVNTTSGTSIGNGTVGGRNIVSGNNGVGLALSGNASTVTVLGNYFGLAADGFTQIRNGTSGITLAGVSNVQIGDGSAGGRNIISGNGSGGSFDHGVFASNTTNLTFSGNYVGVAADGATVVGNSQAGIVFQSLNSQSGHSNAVVSDNVISGNVLGGADISSFDAGVLGAPSSITFTGNKVGVAADGVTPAANLGHGIKNTNVPGSIIIGGSGVAQGNIIAHNGGAGVVSEFVSGSNAAVIGNRIYANAQLGIDIGPSGVTANDPGDGDSGPNDLLNFPEAVRAIVSGANQLGYNFTLDAPAAANGYRIEFFASTAADPSGHGQGERFLGHVDITHSGGAQTYTGTLTTLEPISIGTIISATTNRRTAEGSWDITSEFSAVATADGVAALTVAMASEVFDPPADNPFATPGNDILLTTTVSNGGTGSTDADTIFVAIALDPNNSFFNDVTPALGGVIGFTSAEPSLTFTPNTDLRFSNSAAAPTSFDQCTYVPAAGYDPQVRHICLNPKGSLPSGGPNGQFAVQIRVRIN